MKFNKDHLDKPWVAYTVAACAAVGFYALLGNIGNIARGIGIFFGMVSPVITAIVMAYVLNPLVKWVRAKIFGKMQRPVLATNLSIAVSVIALILAFSLLMVALVPQIVVSVQGLVTNFDSYVASLQSLIDLASANAAQSDIDISGIADFGDKVLGMLQNFLSENMERIVNTTVDFGKSVFNAVISFILAIYFLGDKDRLVGGIKRFLRRVVPMESYVNAAGFLHRCNDIMVRYIAYDILDGVIVGVANFVFMLIFRMPYAVLISVVVGVTNLAPTFGPLVGGIIGAFILVLVNPWHALWFILFTIVLQTVDGYVLKPRLFGGSLGVSGVWILVSIVVMGRMFGVAGILMAIPFAAIVDFVYHDLLFKGDLRG